MNQTVITTQNLCKKFCKHEVIDDLELSVPQGSIYGFLGKNGAGKTTTIRMLMGLLPPEKGNISVLGLDPFKNGIAMKRRVGYVADQPYFYDRMKVSELIGFVRDYYPDWDRQFEKELQRDFHLDGEKKVGELSRGMTAKLSLLLALSHRPELLILDEPTNGLDPAARREFVEGILSHYQDEGRTVFISSHLVNEIAGIVDHVGILKGGRLMRDQRADELRKQVRAIRLVYTNGLIPSSREVDGILSSKVNGREWDLIVDGYSEKTEQQIRGLGADEITWPELSLEDIFIALLPSEEEA